MRTLETEWQIQYILYKILFDISENLIAKRFKKEGEQDRFMRDIHQFFTDIEENKRVNKNGSNLTKITERVKTALESLDGEGSVTDAEVEQLIRLILSAEKFTWDKSK